MGPIGEWSFTIKLTSEHGIFGAFEGIGSKLKTGKCKIPLLRCGNIPKCDHL